MKKQKTNGKTKTAPKAAKAAKPSRGARATPPKPSPAAAACGKTYSMPPMRAVTCTCARVAGHTGMHRGLDRNGKPHDWHDTDKPRDAVDRFKSGEGVLVSDFVRDRDARAAKKATKGMTSTQRTTLQRDSAAESTKPSARLARGETVPSHELTAEQDADARARAPQTSDPIGTAPAKPFAAPAVPDFDPAAFKPVDVVVGSKVVVAWGPGEPRHGVVDRFTRDGNPVVRMERVTPKGERIVGEYGSEGRTFMREDIVGVVHPTIRHSLTLPAEGQEESKRVGRLMVMTSEDINEMIGGGPADFEWQRDITDRGGIKRTTAWSTLIAATSVREQIRAELEAVGCTVEMFGARLKITDYVPNHRVPQTDHDSAEVRREKLNVATPPANATVGGSEFPITKATAADVDLAHAKMRGFNSVAEQVAFDERVAQVFEMSSESINADIAAGLREPLTEPVEWRPVTIEADTVVGWVGMFKSWAERDIVRDVLVAAGYKTETSARGMEFWIQIIGRDLRDRQLIAGARPRPAPDVAPPTVASAAFDAPAPVVPAVEVTEPTKPPRKPRASKGVTVSKVIREPGKPPVLVDDDLPPFERPEVVQTVAGGGGPGPTAVTARGAGGVPTDSHTRSAVAVVPSPTDAHTRTAVTMRSTASVDAPTDLPRPTVEAGATDPVLLDEQQVREWKRNPRTIPDGHPLLYTAAFSMERRRRALEGDAPAAPVTVAKVGVPAHDASRLEDETRRRDAAMAAAKANADVADPSRVIARGDAVVETRAPGETWKSQPQVDDDAPPWDVEPAVEAVDEDVPPWA